MLCAASSSHDRRAQAPVPSPPSKTQADYSSFGTQSRTVSTAPYGRVANPVSAEPCGPVAAIALAGLAPLARCASS